VAQAGGIGNLTGTSPSGRTAWLPIVGPGTA